jgi:hypothetical protein
MRDLLTRTVELIPHAETVVLAGQGHDLLRETAQVCDHILAWLGKAAMEGNNYGTLDHSQ